MICTKCNQPINERKGYFRTKRGFHHYECGVKNLPDAADRPAAPQPVSAGEQPNVPQGAPGEETVEAMLRVYDAHFTEPCIHTHEGDLKRMLAAKRVADQRRDEEWERAIIAEKTAHSGGEYYAEDKKSAEEFVADICARLAGKERA